MTKMKNVPWDSPMVCKTVYVPNLKSFRLFVMKRVNGWTDEQTNGRRTEPYYTSADQKVTGELKMIKSLIIREL